LTHDSSYEIHIRGMLDAVGGVVPRAFPDERPAFIFAGLAIRQ